jgi:hypothetical protein
MEPLYQPSALAFEGKVPAGGSQYDLFAFSWLAVGSRMQ